jgi:2-methylisocitrate lyase-like PEP mutase family enzyme
MRNKFEEFVALHQTAEPVLIGNAWNVASAKAFEQQKFKAVGTSSAAVAASLGYEDGQQMSLNEYMFIIKRIAESVSVPFTVDFESGYGNSHEEICYNIRKLYALGVAGVNLEDSVVENGIRSIIEPELFAAKIRKITERLKAEHIQMFINIRSDSFLLGLPDAFEDALKRINLYQETGVQGLFFPCVTKISDIERITAVSRLPVNVMCMPDLPGFEQLQQAGVKRISVGPFLFSTLYDKLNTSIEQIVKEKSFSNLF